MGIASGVFWIAFGLVYILYKAFRENPTGVLSGALLFLILTGSVGLFYLVSNLLVRVSPVLLALWAILCLGGVLYWLYRLDKKEKEKLRRIVIELDVVRRETERIAAMEKYPDSVIDEYTKGAWSKKYKCRRSNEYLNYICARTAEEKAAVRKQITECYRNEVRWPVIHRMVGEKLDADKAAGLIDDAWYESSGAGWGEGLKHIGG